MKANAETDKHPAQWRSTSRWPVDLSTDPFLRKTFDVLRAKWNEVPFTMLDRIKTADLDRLSDDELLRLWTKGFLERAPLGESGWAHLLYRDVFRGRKVLDIGSGMGFDTIYFAEHGATVTFVDIARSNLRVVERICGIKGLQNVSFCYLEDLRSLETLPTDFDFIYAEGSLINAPLEVTRAEAAALVRHLRVGGRFITLGYPRARWEREGRLPEAEWGRMTDGGAPWIEWFDLDKVLWFLHPAKFDTVLHFEMHNSDYNWFDLLRVEGSALAFIPSSTTPQEHQPIEPMGRGKVETDILPDLQPTQLDWNSIVQIVDGKISVKTGPEQWAYACAFRLDGAMPLDPDQYYWVRITIAVSCGEIGICLLRGNELVSERFACECSSMELFLPLVDPLPDHLVLRNTSNIAGGSAADILSADIVSEPKVPVSSDPAPARSWSVARSLSRLGRFRK